MFRSDTNEKGKSVEMRVLLRQCPFIKSLTKEVAVTATTFLTSVIHQWTATCYYFIHYVTNKINCDNPNAKCFHVTYWTFKLKFRRTIERANFCHIAFVDWEHLGKSFIGKWFHGRHITRCWVMIVVNICWTCNAMLQSAIHSLTKDIFNISHFKRKCYNKFTLSQKHYLKSLLFCQWILRI